MKYQVRNMVGTLIKIGSLKYECSIINDIFKDVKYKKYVSCAKREGLYLVSVDY